MKQLIAQAKEVRKEPTEKTRATARVNFTDRIPAKAEGNIWLVEPVDTHNKPAAPGVEIEKNSLGAAIFAVEMLSTKDRSAFHCWYRRAQMDRGSDAISDDVVLIDYSGSTDTRARIRAATE